MDVYVYLFNLVRELSGDIRGRVFDDTKCDQRLHEM